MGTSATCTIVGHLGADPEIKKIPNKGTEVVEWTMAVNSKRGGDDFTDWYKAISFREAIIDLADKYLKKGHNVVVTGQLRQVPWEDRDGKARVTMEVLVDNVTLIDGGGTGGGRGDDRGGRGDDRGRGRDDDRGRGRDDRGGGRGDDRGRGRDDRGGGRGDDRGGREASRGRDDRGGRDAPRGRDAGRGRADNDLDDEIPF